MKKTTIFTALFVAFILSACGESDAEKQAEKDAAIAKKTGSMEIPRVHVDLDKKGQK